MELFTIVNIWQLLDLYYHRTQHIFSVYSVILRKTLYVQETKKLNIVLKE